VVASAGFRGARVREGLDLLRSASALFPGDAEVRGAAFYLRHNTHAPCPVAVGARVPVELGVFAVAPGGAPVPAALGEVLAGAALTVICAGSGT